METSFIGGVRRSTQREPPTMGKLYHLRLTTFSGVRATTYKTCNIFSGMNIEPSSPSMKGQGLQLVLKSSKIKRADTPAMCALDKCLIDYQ